jgi:hypothetical protein
VLAATTQPLPHVPVVVLILAMIRQREDGKKGADGTEFDPLIQLHYETPSWDGLRFLQAACRRNDRYSVSMDRSVLYRVRSCKASVNMPAATAPVNAALAPRSPTARFQQPHACDVSLSLCPVSCWPRFPSP